MIYENTTTIKPDSTAFAVNEDGTIAVIFSGAFILLPVRVDFLRLLHDTATAIITAPQYFKTEHLDALEKLVAVARDMHREANDND